MPKAELLLTILCHPKHISIQSFRERLETYTAMAAILLQPFLEQTHISESSLELEALSSECPQFWQILAIRVGNF